MRASDATTTETGTREGLLVATPERDGYEVLGVPPDADSARIRAAFRDLAARYHPDRNADPNAADRFTEITEAYAALSGSSTREGLEDPSVAEARRTGRCPGVAWLSPMDLWAGVDTTGLVEDRGGGMLREGRGSRHYESVAVERLSSRGRPTRYSKGPHRP